MTDSLIPSSAALRAVLAAVVLAVVCMLATPVSAFAAYSGEITVSSSNPRAGSSVNVSGSGFAAGASVTVKLGADTLGTLTADASGNVSGTIKIPADTAAGDYVLKMSGAAPDSSVLVLTSTLTIRKMANTGVDDLAPVALVGVAAAAGGAVVLVASRRRRRDV